MIRIRKLSESGLIQGKRESFLFTVIILGIKSDLKLDSLCKFPNSVSLNFSGTIHFRVVHMGSVLSTTSIALLREGKPLK